MNYKKILALICSAALAGTMFTGCDDENPDETAKTPSVSDGTVIQDGIAGSKSENTPGNNTETSETDITKISRSKRDKCRPMGEDGTWSIFVYLCGTDLESEAGMASGDIDEMLAVSGSSDIKFIVQTGGTRTWKNEDISGEEMQRYEICDGEMTLIDSVKKENMGDTMVLSDFLSWGVKNYGAARNGLVFWNHGGGSISGVCFDEYTDDSLSLREIDAALYNVRNDMTDDFEFIGFDACLMGTVETASILASHARYMIGSEDLEPGKGWAYTDIGNYLVKHPEANGAELGKVICDSFYASCKADGDEASSTLSVIDLSKIDDVIIKFREFAQDIFNSTENTEQLSEYVRNVRKQENYGGNSFWEGYSNMVDLNGIIKAGEQFSTHTQEASDAVKEAVVYSKNGEYHKESCGLSIYYPLKADGSAEIKIFKDICISTHYLALVDRILYGASNGTLDTYHDVTGILSSVIDWTSSFFGLDDSDDEFYYEPDDEYNAGEDESFWDILFGDWDEYDNEYDGFEAEFDEEPSIDSEGSFSFTLSEDSLTDTSSVSAYVYMISEDEDEYIDLGITSDVYMNWETGTAVDNFDGQWFCFEDGQPLAVYLLEECDGYDIFTSPVLVNYEETNIRFCWDYEHDEITVLGLWDGVDDNGCCSRGGRALEPDDVIVPLYYSYSAKDGSESLYSGDEFTYYGYGCISFNYLPDGDFRYGFIIEDVFGNTYETDSVGFSIEGDDIYYEN